MHGHKVMSTPSSPPSSLPHTPTHLPTHTHTTTTTKLMALGPSSAMPRRQRRLRAVLRHERQTVAMELAAALHHSRDGGRVTNYGLRAPKTASSVKKALERQKEEEEAKVKRLNEENEERRMLRINAKVSNDIPLKRWIVAYASSSSSSGKRRKRKKKRKRKLPKSSSSRSTCGRARRRQRQWQCSRLFSWFRRFSRCVPFVCRHAGVSRHLGRYGPEGQWRAHRRFWQWHVLLLLHPRKVLSKEE